MDARNIAAADALLAGAVPHVAPAAQLVVRSHGDAALSRCYGWLDPERRAEPVGPATLFDLASVTKLFVAAALMRLAEDGRLALDGPVSAVLPELSGLRPIQPYEDPLAPGGLVAVVDGGAPVDAGAVTFRQLLTHTSGLPAWRPLFRQASRDAALHMALGTPFAYPTGARVVYSDIGLIALGRALERLAGAPLDRAVADLVIAPLGLRSVRYLPPGAPAPTDVAPTDTCAWRGRRLRGEVHDENAAALGGVSGHAGLFASAEDLAAFGQALLDGVLLRRETVAEMARLQAEDGAVRRGLGFALWSPDPEASGNPLSRRAFGHTGFTGTSLWIDPERELVVALLTNDVYGGRAGRGIAGLRVALHRALVGAPSN